MWKAQAKITKFVAEIISMQVLLILKFSFFHECLIEYIQELTNYY